MDPLFDVDRDARFQHGVVTDDQLTQSGSTRQKRRTLVQRGVLRRIDHGVYRAIGAQRTWKQDILAACLAAGPDAVVSHRAAAVIWELVDPPAPVEMTVPYETRPLPLDAVRHRSQTLRDVDRTRRHGSP